MNPTAAKILEYFATLVDSRVERTKEHLLLGIIAITICGVLCGTHSWVVVEN